MDWLDDPQDWMMSRFQRGALPVATLLSLFVGTTCLGVMTLRLPVLGIVFAICLVVFWVVIFAFAAIPPVDADAPAQARRRWWQWPQVPVATERELRLNRWRIVLSLLFVPLCGGQRIFLFSGPSPARFVLLGILLLCILVYFVVQHRTLAVAKASLTHLRATGYRVCPLCRYDLSKVEAATCPECGRPCDLDSLKRRWEDVYRWPGGGVISWSG